VTGPLWNLLDLPSKIDPSREILRFRDRSFTLEELRDRAMSLAVDLPAGRVGIMDVNSDVLVALTYACFHADVPVALVNFRLGSEELAQLTKLGRFSTLAVGTRYEETARQASVAAGLGDSSALIDADRATVGLGSLTAAIVTDRDHFSGVILFTSGTTALPKPVFLSGAELVTYVMASTPACPPDTGSESTLLTMPLYHVAGLVGLLRSVFAGRRVVLLEQFKEATWLEAVSHGDITHAFVVPTMLARIIEAPEFAASDLSSLRVVTYGGGPMPQILIEKALRQFPASVSFVSTYGMTEAGGTVTVLDASDHDAARVADPAARRRLASVGCPVPGVRLAIVDPDHGLVPAGTVGEVFVVGSRAPEADENMRWLGERILQTGDLGHLDDDGYLYLRGRADDMIIRGGENIAPLEVEEALRSHPAVRDCAVVGIQDETWGQRVVAAVVLQGTADSESLIRHCRGRLASFKVPEEVQIIDYLPNNGVGKLLRGVLRRQLQEHSTLGLAKTNE
jgi:fatty-acyl-CoA synthase